MARLVGQKRAREMWFLARFYSADQAHRMGLVNTVVPLDQLEGETGEAALARGGMGLGQTAVDRMAAVTTRGIEHRVSRLVCLGAVGSGLAS